MSAFTPREVFRVKPGTKVPAVLWSKRENRVAPDDLPPGERRGVPTGPENGVFVIDLDRGKQPGVDGLASLKAYVREHGLDLPDTFAVRTPSGGWHLFFAWSDAHPVGNRAGVLPGIDLRGAGGYVVGGGEGEGAYVVARDVPPAPAPAWLFDLVGRKADVAPGDAPAVAIGPEHPEWSNRLEMARTFIASEAPCVEGEGRSEAQCFKMGLRLSRTCELPPETSLELLAEYFAACRPPGYIVDKMRRALVRAAEVGQGPTGMFAAAFLAPGPTVPAPVDDAVPALPQTLIVMKPDQHHQTVREACAAIGNEPSVYQRGGELVHLVRIADTDADDAHVAGTPTIRPMHPATIKAALSRVAVFEKPRAKGGGFNVKPDDDVVTAVRVSGEWPCTRVLNGISETPLLRADGSIVQAAGYDAATGYVYDPMGADFPRVPDAPTRDDARRALAELAEVFADFPYSSEESRAVPVAALLTILARPAIRGNTPLFVLEASTRGSGKTLQADSIATIATGRRTSKATWPGNNDEEVEKILGGYARQGVGVFSFDNVSSRGGLGGSPLDKYLTCGDTVDARILGRTEMVQCKWRTVILATGNNVTMRGDTSRRALVSRLESPLERPEDRKDFRHPDLLAWVRSERPRLVAAALTLLRAFFVAGCPLTVRRMGSFEEWSSIVPSAIVWAGGPDATKAAPAPEADAEVSALGDMLAAWPPGLKTTTPELLAGPVTLPPEFRNAVGAFLDDPYITPKAASQKLWAVRGQVVGGRSLRVVDGRPRRFYAA